MLSKSRLLATAAASGVDSSSESLPSESDVVVGAAVLTEPDADETRVLILTKFVTLALMARPVEVAELDEAGALELLDVQTLLELLHVLLEEGACQVLVELVVGATQTDDEVVGACQVDYRKGTT